MLSIHIDESLFFASVRFLEDKINNAVADNPKIEQVILMCPAVSSIDASALESLEAIEMARRK
ncbi:MAG: sodium-independent anion transporter [Paracoccaceae bacterium]